LTLFSTSKLFRALSVPKLTAGWVGSEMGKLFGGFGWAGSMKTDPRTTLWSVGHFLLSRDFSRPSVPFFRRSDSA